MPIFEIETPNGKFEVDAPDMDMALQALELPDESQPDPNAAPVPAVDPYADRARREADIIGNPQMAGNLGYKILNGLTFGGADEINAAINTVPRMVKDRVGLTEAYKREDALIDEQIRRSTEQNPISSVVGEIGGGLLSAGAAVKGGLTLAGRLGPNAGLAKRTAAGGAEAAAYGGLYGFNDAENGNRLENAAVSAGMGAVGGAALPALGAAARKTASGVRSVVSPSSEAQKRVQGALSRDSGQKVLNPADEAAAAMNAQGLINVDRGGETTRALARAASNVAPDARATIQRVAEDRFTSQSDRAVGVIKRIAGDVDDIAIKDGIVSAARVANKTNYNKAYAYNFGKQHPMELDALLPRVPAAAMRDAMKIAKAEGRAFGKQLVASIDDNTDTVVFSRKPSFEELDYIQRGLRAATDAEYRKGAGNVGAAYKELRKELLGVMDGSNPYFKQARAGAAQAFGAEDALEAGKKFMKATRNTPEMQQALKTMSAKEKNLFKAGFASEMIDKVNSVNDRSNAIRSMFQSPEMRAKLTQTFGQAKAREFEAFVRVEVAMDALRGAMGNSTTARQLAEMGLVGGGNAVAGGYGIATGDWRAAGIAGGLTAARYGKSKIDEAVMREIAEILTSGDPKLINKLAANASMSAKYLGAVARVTDQLTKIATPAVGVGAAMATGAARGEPLDIGTIHPK